VLDLSEVSVGDEQNLVITETEAARRLSVSTRTLQRLRIDGGGPGYVKLSERRVGYSPAALRRWIEERSAASTSAVTVSRRGA
jgi:predicted DNA-binding transcriptional regulator AlpA